MRRTHATLMRQLKADPKLVAEAFSHRRMSLNGKKQVDSREVLSVLFLRERIDCR
jgi:hypothetical protein